MTWINNCSKIVQWNITIALHLRVHSITSILTVLTEEKQTNNIMLPPPCFNRAVDIFGWHGSVLCHFILYSMTIFLFLHQQKWFIMKQQLVLVQSFGAQLLFIIDIYYNKTGSFHCLYTKFYLSVIYRFTVEVVQNYSWGSRPWLTNHIFHLFLYFTNQC